MADRLKDLLVAAAEAPPQSRIALRDSIAVHGAEAIRLLVEPIWIGDPKYAAFAIRVIARAGALGAREEAIDALLRAQRMVETDHHRTDIAAALSDLRSRHTSTSAGAKRTSTATATASVEELVTGRCYQRRALHLAGIGGNWQKGISYPADGTYCLLFSDPSKVSEYGYRDAPLGDDGYRYFGEWSGTGDMTMTGGNQAILDRSRELYLLTRASCGHLFRGRYECTGWDWERATREGREHRAIVFTLRRMN